MVDHPHHLHTQKSIKIREYAEALEEERRKIQVFQRELPLCLQLVTQAIDSCRQQMQTGVCSDCEETSSEDRGGPVLEEFMPIKRSCEDTQLKQLEEQKDKERLGGKKPDWLRSVQLWNQEENPESNQRLILGENEAKKKGAFHPFCRDKMMLTSTTTAAAAMPTQPSVVTTVAASSSTAETNGGEEKEGGQSQRKTRRCWSPELHRRFLHALQQLGGSHVATPKQIRELMKVDGLTNDEVKSHLQKYRLHTRRPSPAIQSNNNAQPTQFVVVGGIWVPPELAAAAAAQSTDATGGGTATPTIYAPMAAAPLPRQQNSLTEHSVADDANSSHSPASSSSHTTSLL